MHPAEVQTCLDSMTILVDTREQPSKRATKRYEQFGCFYRRQKLDYGDYTFSFTFPGGAELHPPEVNVKGHAVIERKMSLEELSGCFCKGRERFKREFERAKEADAHIYLLVENATWEMIWNGRYKTQFAPEAFIASIIAWQIRYKFQLVFCKEETSGKLIKEILYRELKEELETGRYG